ncbi:hypothetical protein KP509_25G044700 [Ceratopteris richardii]|uniref:Uncharacterized protein n=1 Tax=Ceratopteris richardii TaxID=49495 RepID=A0A8T2RPW5_CERRI|nr:hypothetical protein KP509_25G044700 [Ceratopteris richardii]
MLHLKPPAWAERFSATKEGEEKEAPARNREKNSSLPLSASFSQGSSSSVPAPVVASASPVSPLITELVASLTDRRLYREIILAIRLGLEDARADFSFLRVKGLKALIKTLASLSTSDTLIHLFQDSQTDKTLQVIPVLFEHSLASSRNTTVLVSDPLSLEGPQRIVSPPTDYEVALALRVLEGCCLLDKRSRVTASEYMAVKEVMELLSAGGVLEQTACLDVLPALMLDTPINQQEFLRCQGIRKISELVKLGHADEAMRLKCAELVLLLVGNTLPCSNDEASELQPLADSVLKDVHELFGDNFSSILRTAAPVPPSLSDDQVRGEALHAQAKILLEHVDSGTW